MQKIVKERNEGVFRSDRTKSVLMSSELHDLILPSLAHIIAERSLNYDPRLRKVDVRIIVVARNQLLRQNTR